MPNENKSSSSFMGESGEMYWRNIMLALSRAMLRWNELDNAQANLDDALVILERLVNDASISSTDD